MVIVSMAQSSVDIETLEKLIAPVCDAQGVELVDIRHQREPGGAVLRLLIDAPGAETRPAGAGGVTLDDCTRVSRAVSAALGDDDTLIPGAYRLEVSSPGIERPLVKPRDFERFAGREVHVQTKQAASQRKNFTGILLGLRDGRTVLVRADEDQLEIPFSEVAKAHLVYRF